MRRGRKGSAIIETAVLTPVVVMLLVGMTQIAQITLTYYSLKKSIYSTATWLSAQQGVNFCDPGDASVVAALNYGVTGTADGSGQPVVSGLTAGMIRITPLRYNSVDQTIGEYTCDVTPTRPDFIEVSIPDGYIVQPSIPFFSLINAIPLRPQVEVPYGGT